MAYALGSMAWSHAYLAGVEAVRWFVFALIVWLALNTFSRERLPMLAVHPCRRGARLAVGGAAVLDRLQSCSRKGRHPRSTFINRNFFAEFAVGTLPFGVLLLARARARRRDRAARGQRGLGDRRRC